MLTISLKPWTQLTRFGIPSFRVVRRPIVSLGETANPGDLIPASLIGNRIRLRQLYDARLIEPAIAPAGTVQAVLQMRRDLAELEEVALSPVQAETAASPLFDVPSIPIEEETPSVVREYSPTSRRKGR